MNAHPAAGDCEAIRDGWLAQPTNAGSSLAYIAVGGWIVARALRAPRPERVPAVVLGALVTANGIGGVAFHGPGTAPGRWLHDAALLGTLGVVAALGARELAVGANRSPAFGARPLGVGLVAVGSVTVAWPAGTVPMTAMLAGAALGIETVNAPARWRRVRASRGPWVVAAGALAVGAVAHLLGRSGGAWCRPDSFLQAHALWHVATAVALGSWAVGAGWVPRARRSPRGGAASDQGGPRTG